MEVAKTVAVLDTNALLLPFQKGINIDAELRRLLGDCEIVVPSSVARELRRLAGEKRGSDAAAAYALSQKYMQAKSDSGAGVDSAVLRAAKSLGAVLVTNDRGMQKAYLASGGRVAALRSGTHLELLGAPG